MKTVLDIDELSTLIIWDDKNPVGTLGRVYRRITEPSKRRFAMYIQNAFVDHRVRIYRSGIMAKHYRYEIDATTITHT